jgi:hypothetical protein
MGVQRVRIAPPVLLHDLATVALLRQPGGGSLSTAGSAI